MDIKIYEVNATYSYFPRKQKKVEKKEEDETLIKPVKEAEKGKYIDLKI